MSNRSRRRDAGLKEADYVMTLAEIAKELGVSRERVRQLENRALAKAQQILKRRGFTLQDLMPEGERHG